MSKFKIGDKVRVREDLKIKGDYEGLSFDEKMKNYRGLETIIADVDCDGDYKLKNCGDWYFNDEMLEKVIQKTVEYDEKLKCYFICDDKYTLCFRDFGVATKHPDDQYDEEIGRALAYKRLVESDYYE